MDSATKESRMKTFKVRPIRFYSAAAILFERRIPKDDSQLYNENYIGN